MLIGRCSGGYLGCVCFYVSFVCVGWYLVLWWYLVDGYGGCGSVDLVYGVLYCYWIISSGVEYWGRSGLWLVIVIGVK